MFVSSVIQGQQGNGHVFSTVHNAFVDAEDYLVGDVSDIVTDDDVDIDVENHYHGDGVGNYIYIYADVGGSW